MAHVLPANAAAIVGQRAFTGAKDKDIAAELGVAVTTLKRHFGPILVKQRALRRMTLAGAQLKYALKGNPAMLIWLGKQAIEAGGLGQRDELAWGKVDPTKMSDEELDRFIKSASKPGLRVVK